MRAPRPAPRIRADPIRPRVFHVILEDPRNAAAKRLAAFIETRKRPRVFRSSIIWPGAELSRQLRAPQSEPKRAGAAGGQKWGSLGRGLGRGEMRETRARWRRRLGPTRRARAVQPVARPRRRRRSPSSSWLRQVGPTSARLSHRARRPYGPSAARALRIPTKTATNPTARCDTTTVQRRACRTTRRQQDRHLRVDRAETLAQSGWIGLYHAGFVYHKAPRLSSKEITQRVKRICPHALIQTPPPRADHVPAKSYLRNGEAACSRGGSGTFYFLRSSLLAGGLMRPLRTFGALPPRAKS